MPRKRRNTDTTQLEERGLPDLALFANTGFAPFLTAEPQQLARNGAKTETWVAVGTLITERPPHRSVRALLTHTAPTLDAWRQSERWGGENGGKLGETGVNPKIETRKLGTPYIKRKGVPCEQSNVYSGVPGGCGPPDRAG
jgi:hypothetical protein